MPESQVATTLFLQFLVILALVLVNGLFAMSEIAIVSVRRARMQQLSEEGDRRAQVVLELAADPNTFLSTIQIGITLVGILAGAYGGATIAPVLATLLAGVPILGRYASAVALTIAVVGTTFLSLVVGELVPKRLALHYAEPISLGIARPMRALSRLVGPAVSLLSGSTEVLTRVFGIRGYAEPPVTEEEIRVLVEQGTIAGIIEEVERDMVERVFRMGERQVDAIMRPRTEVVWLNIEDPTEEVRRVIEESSYSRFPVARESLDEILGIVHVKDLLLQCLAGEPLDLQKALSEPLYIPESMQVFQVLELFKQAGLPIALVVDEYGIFQGLVTLDDILEGIVGEIPERDEIEEPMAVQREDGSWLLDGLLPVDDFKDLFGIEQLPEEEEYQTLAGFVVAQLGRIPAATDHFQWDKLRLEVMDMDGNRVDKVLVTPVEDKTTQE
ncbi:MAG: HlyC/CorC family transporter [Anaerolineae bacterium]|nr:HlyC/CorC family transporter [Anaerolineae bacterium]